MIYENKKIFFVTGSGRSGTNITRKILEKNYKIASLGFQERFIVDPDGIIDFYTSYNDNWSPHLIDKKIKRLECFLSDLSRSSPKTKVFSNCLNLLRKAGINIAPKRYSNWELSQHIPNFEKHSKELIKNLYDFEYPALWYGTESYKSRPIIYHSSPRPKEKIVHIFQTFLGKVIGEVLKEKKASFFLGDATLAFLCAEKIREILPEAKFIVPIRDGRDVTASLTHQRWAPKKVKEAAIYYRDIMNYWFSVKENLPSDSFHEFKLEDLVKNPGKEIQKICSFLGINYEKKMIEINLSESHSGRWEKDFSEEEKTEVSKIISGIQKKLGYE